MSSKKSPLRGSVRQNNMTSRARIQEQDGVGFLTRLGILTGLVLAFVIVGIVGWHSGWPQRIAKDLYRDSIDLTKEANFEVRDIVVEGLNQSSREEISDALGIKQGIPILSVDTAKAAERVGKLPWVKTAIVERRLPDTVALILTERAPMARWQKNQRLFVIDMEGEVIDTADPDDFSALPLLVGNGAEEQAKALLATLRTYPEIADILKSAIRVSQRRWDLHVAPNTVVRLPEEGVNHALHRLSVLMAEENILERNLVAIDLRLTDRLVLEPAEDSAQPSD